jgi:hypothetical protein
MIEFLDSVTLQKLVDEQLGQGHRRRRQRRCKRAHLAAAGGQAHQACTAPNSVFALGSALSK